MAICGQLPSWKPAWYGGKENAKEVFDSKGGVSVLGRKLHICRGEVDSTPVGVSRKKEESGRRLGEISDFLKGSTERGASRLGVPPSRCSRLFYRKRSSRKKMTSLSAGWTEPHPLCDGGGTVIAGGKRQSQEKG